VGDFYMIEKLKKYFPDMIVYKSAGQGKFFSTLSVPSFMRDWLLMKFADENGRINQEEVATYVRRVIPKKEQWEEKKYNMVRNMQNERFLAKVKIEIDIATRTAYFSLPDFGVPKKRDEAIVEWNVIEAHKDYLLSPNEVWGIVELICDMRTDLSRTKSVIKMIDFSPFCPYNVDLDYYIEARDYFTTEEWIDVLLGAIDYNPEGYTGEEQKIAMLSRLLPFIEKRVNLIELAPKETGKSYVFSQLSKYGWLVSGGSISRAKMFYDQQKKTTGLAVHYDYVAFDEVQSLTFTDKNEMQGVLKGYLESPTGEFRIGNYRGIGESGLILLGNIYENMMDVNVNMFADLPDIFHESALIDRFHGFIKGWEIPKMRENLKVNGWALNVEYFTEILHLMRGELIYRAIVDEVLDVPKNAATRDTEAVKRICTAFLKLLFPNVTTVNKLNFDEFEYYCLQPALKMRGVIKTQLGIIDSEFRGKTIPDIKVKVLPRK